MTYFLQMRKNIIISFQAWFLTGLQTDAADLIGLENRRCPITSLEESNNTLFVESSSVAVWDEKKYVKKLLYGQWNFLFWMKKHTE